MKVESIRGLKIRDRKPPKRQVGNVISFWKDFFDLLLKGGAVALPFPALLIYSYLGLIGRTDLFSTSVLSLAGLSALLQVTLIMIGVLVIGFYVSSFFLGHSLVEADGKSLQKGVVGLVLLNAIEWAAFYGAGYLEWVKESASVKNWFGWVVATIFIVSLLLSWKGPQSLRIVVEQKRKEIHHPPIDSPEFSFIKFFIKEFIRFLCFPGFWHRIFIVLPIVIAGFFSFLPILVISIFGDAYGLSEKGSDLAVTIGIVVFLSLLPGAAYLKAKERSQSSKKALLVAVGIALVVLVFPFFVGELSFLRPMAMVSMKWMGLVETTPRTYEILKPDTRRTFKDMGYTPESGDQFVDAVIRFQFGDVKLVCPKKFDLPRGWARLNFPPEIDSSGCITLLKDEIRVVNLPKDFKLQRPV